MPGEHYSEQSKREILEHAIGELAMGERSLARIIAEDEGMCSSAIFYRWIENDQEMIRLVERARELGATKMIEQIPEIAESVAEEKNAIAKAKLRIYARESYAAKIAPKRFGQKLDLTSGNEKLTSNTDNRLQAIIALAQRRKKGEDVIDLAPKETEDGAD